MITGLANALSKCNRKIETELFHLTIILFVEKVKLPSRSVLVTGCDTGFGLKLAQVLSISNECSTTKKSKQINIKQIFVSFSIWKPWDSLSLPGVFWQIGIAA